jgi:hypothetical protein
MNWLKKKIGFRQTKMFGLKPISLKRNWMLANTIGNSTDSCAEKLFYQIETI